MSSSDTIEKPRPKMDREQAKQRVIASMRSMIKDLRKNGVGNLVLEHKERAVFLDRFGGSVDALLAYVDEQLSRKRWRIIGDETVLVPFDHDSAPFLECELKPGLRPKKWVSTPVLFVKLSHE